MFEIIDTNKFYNKIKVGKHIVHVPSVELRQLQQIMRYKLELQYNPMQCVVAYIKNRSIVDAVKPHLNNEIWLRVDIYKFFEHVRPELLYNELKRFVDDEFAKEIIKFNMIKYDDGSIGLPIGSPMAPILSNVAMTSFDAEMLSTAQSKFVYTRYSDDILISANEIVDEYVNIIKDKLNKFGFSINENKLRLLNKWPKKIFGLVIQRDGSMRIGKFKKDRLRGLAYYLLKSNKEHYYLFKRLVGILSFMVMINDKKLSKSLYILLDNVFKKYQNFPYSDQRYNCRILRKFYYESR